MGVKAGTLLWNRRHVTVPMRTNNGPFLVNTGLRQPTHGFADYSPGEPSLGSFASVASTLVPLVPPVPPILPVVASRVQVVPMAPLSEWTLITHKEPFVDPRTGEVWVEFSNGGKEDAEINVFFWDPHSMVGPGSADTYEQPVED
jgi:hypothetical protein